MAEFTKPPETIPIWEDEFAWFAIIQRGPPPPRLLPGTRLPNGKIVIDAHSEPGPIWLQADPVTGQVTVDEERSVGIQRSPAYDARTDPQYWACQERLDQIEAAAGAGARHQELLRMREGELPPLEQRHVAEANAFRQRLDLAPLPLVRREGTGTN